MGGSANMTVKTDKKGPDGMPLTVDQYTGNADPNKPDAGYGMTPPPADPPTISDGLVQGAELAKRRRLLGSTAGRGGTFLTSPMGDGA